MNSLICSIFISILGLGSVIYTIIPVVNNNTIFEIVSKEEFPFYPPTLPPTLPPSLPPSLSPNQNPCYSCLGNPCRSCYNSEVSGRYEYTRECCSYCGGCIN